MPRDLVGAIAVPLTVEDRGEQTATVPARVGQMNRRTEPDRDQIALIANSALVREPRTSSIATWAASERPPGARSRRRRRGSRLANGRGSALWLPIRCSVRCASAELISRTSSRFGSPPKL
jgi:hypothetical protein